MVDSSKSPFETYRFVPLKIGSIEPVLKPIESWFIYSRYRTQNEIYRSQNQFYRTQNKICRYRNQIYRFGNFKIRSLMFWTRFYGKMLGIIMLRSFYTTHNVEKREIYSRWIFFSRQINYLVKTLLSRKFYQESVRVNFWNFHTVHL